MARRKNGAAPPYCAKKKGKVTYAYVRIQGQQIMLGRHGTPESRQEYARVLAEVEANGGRLHDYHGDSSGYTVGDLHDDYVRHCQVYYRKPDGTLTSETASVVGPLCTPLDLLADRMSLPPADVHDIVVVYQSGAYGPTASPSAFLSHPACKEVLV